MNTWELILKRETEYFKQICIKLNELDQAARMSPQSKLEEIYAGAYDAYIQGIHKLKQMEETIKTISSNIDTQNFGFEFLEDLPPNKKLSALKLVRFIRSLELPSDFFKNQLSLQIKHILIELQNQLGDEEISGVNLEEEIDMIGNILLTLVLPNDVTSPQVNPVMVASLSGAAGFLMGQAGIDGIKNYFSSNNEKVQ
jgi:hypothetical protein